MFYLKLVWDLFICHRISLNGKTHYLTHDVSYIWKLKESVRENVRAIGNGFRFLILILYGYNCRKKIRTFLFYCFKLNALDFLNIFAKKRSFKTGRKKIRLLWYCFNFSGKKREYSVPKTNIKDNLMQSKLNCNVNWDTFYKIQ